MNGTSEWVKTQQENMSNGVINTKCLKGYKSSEVEWYIGVVAPHSFLK